MRMGLGPFPLKEVPRLKFQSPSYAEEVANLPSNVSSRAGAGVALPATAALMVASGGMNTFVAAQIWPRDATPDMATTKRQLPGVSPFYHVSYILSMVELDKPIQ